MTKFKVGDSVKIFTMETTITSIKDAYALEGFDGEFHEDELELVEGVPRFTTNDIVAINHPDSLIMGTLWFVISSFTDHEGDVAYRLSSMFMLNSITMGENSLIKVGKKI